MIVMANYNSEEPKTRGFWYDVEITRKEKKKHYAVYGKLMLGKESTAAEECCIIFVDEIFKIENTEEHKSNMIPNGIGTPEKKKS